MSDKSVETFRRVLQRLSTERANLDADERAALDSIVLSSRVATEAESEVFTHRFADDAAQLAANPRIFKVSLDKETYKLM